MSEQAGRSTSAAQATILPVVVLVVICVVAGALLGAVHSVTSPIAEANAQRKAEETYASLVPEAASFEPVSCDVAGCTAALEARDAAGAVIAHVIVAQSKGYGGQVPIAVAFGPDGTVRSITAMSNEETPGLGTKVANDSYIGQYVGLVATPASPGDIDLISGATISSKAVLAAYNIAVEAYEEVR
ncbi:MAG: FMN-binding protein [Atopobiaceae bacterium]|nr:FMN-binding protein [Atopobiaceae bacterium]MBR1830773.1 FMN-binding protein [Atopobiaceae bacterium]